MNRHERIGPPLLRQRRELLGLTQADVAEQANICRSYYTRIETGDQTGTVEVWQAIAKVLGIPDTHIYKYINDLKEDDPYAAN